MVSHLVILRRELRFRFRNLGEFLNKQSALTKVVWHGLRDFPCLVRSPEILESGTHLEEIGILS